jgi:hypothetical protein
LITNHFYLITGGKMRTRIKIYSWTAIAILVIHAANFAKSEKKITLADPKVSLTESSAVHERLIRLAYKKLEVYSAVRQLRDGKKFREVTDANERLHFRLSNFRSGSIDALKGTAYNTVITTPSEEIIQLMRSGEALNDNLEQLSYRAKWVAGKYGAMFDRNWTIGDVLKLEAARYFDVNRFTSYSVEVSFEGKKRLYQAVVFHHGEPGERRLEFLDTIVGIGGTLTSVWQDQQLPIGFSEPTQRDRTRDSLVQAISRVIAHPDSTISGEEASIKCPSGATLISDCGIARELADFWDVDAAKPWGSKNLKTPTGEEPPSASEAIADVGDIPSADQNLTWSTWYSFDYRGHLAGGAGHYAWAQFNPQCISLPNNMQRCEVQRIGPEYGDEENNHTDWWYHVGTGRDQSNPRTGPRGQNVDCETAVGVAFDTCATSACGVNMTLGINGHGLNASVTVSGGTLWNAGRAEGLRCNLPRDNIGSAGGCNQSAEYGCLPGFIAVGGLCSRSDAFMTQCFRFGDYDFDACACTGGCEGACSPIVVDVLGNGFNMSNASTGVFFDMEGQGTGGQFSWTAANSDDAWLALDRNNNGLIDSGKELFGNITAQDIHPEGVERNGFLALALYDSPAYGGNGDGWITEQDSVFSQLKLWRDDNHNGVSETCELFTLPELGLEKIDLNYRSSRRVDEHGNEFRYRSKVRAVRGSDIGQWAWDVFLVRQP